MRFPIPHQVVKVFARGALVCSEGLQQPIGRGLPLLPRYLEPRPQRSSRLPVLERNRARARSSRKISRHQNCGQFGRCFTGHQLVTPVHFGHSVFASGLRSVAKLAILATLAT
jgi:hypothetical protein